MILFYSGSRSKDVAPEDFDADIMLSYSDFYSEKKSEALQRFEKYKKKFDKRKKRKGTKR